MYRVDQEKVACEEYERKRNQKDGGNPFYTGICVLLPCGIISVFTVVSYRQAYLVFTVVGCRQLLPFTKKGRHDGGWPISGD